MRDQSVLPLGERLEVEAALEAAFAPLRERRTDLSALRVRAAVRWGRGASEPAALRAPAALKWSGAITRLCELSVAVGMSVMVFAAANGPALEPRTVPEEPSVTPAQVRVVSAAEEREIRALRLEWVESLTSRLDAFRLDRYVPFQDWLDPTVVRPVTVRRLVPPAPRTDAPTTRTPY